MLRSLVAIAFILGATTSASAQGVSVTIDPANQDAAAFAQAMGYSIDQLETEITNQLEDLYNTVRPSDYLQAISDAQAFSTKGLGVDYASNPTALSAGVSGNVTVAFGNDGLAETEKDQPVGGLAVNLSIMGGLNLGKFSPKLTDLIVYGNFFSYKADLDELRVHMTNFGAHAQYKILRPKKRARHVILQWGGIDLTGGLEFSRMSFRLARDLPTDMPIGGTMGQSGNVQFTANASGQFDLDSTTITLPAEVSTNLRIFYFLTVFGGAGIDMQLGINKMDVALEGTIQGEVDGSGNGPQDLGTARVTVSDDAGPNKGKLRFFGGLQVNAWRAKAFIQGNVAPDKAFGLTLGGRMAW